MEKNQEDDIDFINLVLMLNQNAMISLGESPRFVGGMKKQNLPHARQTINMIKSIQDKSKGNLTPGETKLVFRILGELQAKYAKTSGLDKPGPVKSSNSEKQSMEKTLENLSNNDLAKIIAELNKHAGKDK